jgi:hypothetical protein
MDDVSIQLSRLTVAVELGALCWWGLHVDKSDEGASRQQALRTGLR